MDIRSAPRGQIGTGNDALLLWHCRLDQRGAAESYDRNRGDASTAAGIAAPVGKARAAATVA